MKKTWWISEILLKRILPAAGLLALTFALTIPALAAKPDKSNGGGPNAQNQAPGNSGKHGHSNGNDGKGNGNNLYDPEHLAKPTEDYYFRNQSTTSCEVYVGGRGRGPVAR